MGKKPDKAGKRRDYEVGYGKPPKHTQFGQPGGNPMNRLGRPKGPSIVEALIKELRKPLKGGDGEETRCHAVARSLLSLAESGGQQAVQAINSIMNRMDGPVPREIGGVDGGPIFLSKVFIDVNASLAAVGVLTTADVDLIGEEGEE